MRIHKYYCDFCGKEVKTEYELHKLGVTIPLVNCVIEKEICAKCIETFKEEFRVFWGNAKKFTDSLK